MNDRPGEIVLLMALLMSMMLLLGWVVVEFINWLRRK